MRRIRQLGMFQGLELDAEELEGPSPEFSGVFDWWRARQTDASGCELPLGDPTYDPESDPLDDPFPEELR